MVVGTLLTGFYQRASLPLPSLILVTPHETRRP